MRRVLSLGFLILSTTILHSQTRPYWRHTADPIPLECRNTLEHLNWQWRVNPITRKQSPIRALKAAANGKDKKNILNELYEGQSRNRNARDLYRACADARGAEYLAYVAAASSELTCDEAKLTSYLRQTYDGRPGPYIALLDSLQRAQVEPDLTTQDRQVLKHYSRLLEYRGTIPGLIEHTETNSLGTLRACFRDDSQRFLIAARQIVP